MDAVDRLKLTTLLIGKYELTRRALVDVLEDHISRRLPLRRLVQLSTLMSIAKICLPASIVLPLVDRIHDEQKADGGWVDCEDTAWAIAALKAFAPDCKTTLQRALGWLLAERSGNGWGYCKRDEPSIPLTSTILLFCDELRTSEAVEWLTRTWERDYNAKYQLSYKAAWYLLATMPQGTLATQTKDLLMEDQRDSGAWGPWRNHPAPDDCFATGIAMWALASQCPIQIVAESLVRSIKWINNHRLPNGLFPTHYIESGSAWLAVGEHFALKAATGKV